MRKVERYENDGEKVAGPRHKERGMRKRVWDLRKF